MKGKIKKTNDAIITEITDIEILEKFNQEKIVGVPGLISLINSGKILVKGYEYDFTDILNKYQIKFKNVNQIRIFFSPNENFIKRYYGEKLIEKIILLNN